MPASTVVVGKVQIIGLLDTYMQFPWSVFMPAVDRAEIERYRSVYAGSFDGEDFRTRASAYVIRSGGKTILCDTGIGPGPHSWLGGLTGNLVPDMEAKGLSPSDVDIVVFTHLHGDHVGWNLSADGKPMFSNARYLVPQADWEFFSQTAASNPQMQVVSPLNDLGVMELVSGETAITADVKTYPTPGHTPGHQSLVISSNRETAILTGDLAHYPAQVEHIDWCSAFDMDPATCVESRRKVFDQLENEGAIAGFCHFPEAPFGKLIRLQGTRTWRAIG